MSYDARLSYGDTGSGNEAKRFMSLCFNEIVDPKGFPKTISPSAGVARFWKPQRLNAQLNNVYPKSEDETTNYSRCIFIDLPGMECSDCVEGLGKFSVNDFEVIRHLDPNSVSTRQYTQYQILYGRQDTEADWGAVIFLLDADENLLRAQYTLNLGYPGISILSSPQTMIETDLGEKNGVILQEPRNLPLEISQLFSLLDPIVKQSAQTLDDLQTLLLTLELEAARGMKASNFMRSVKHPFSDPEVRAEWITKFSSSGEIANRLLGRDELEIDFRPQGKSTTIAAA